MPTCNKAEDEMGRPSNASRMALGNCHILAAEGMDLIGHQSAEDVARVVRKLLVAKGQLSCNTTPTERSTWVCNAHTLLSCPYARAC